VSERIDNLLTRDELLRLECARIARTSPTGGDYQVAAARALYDFITERPAKSALQRILDILEEAGVGLILVDSKSAPANHAGAVS
jgi:hypothetical protein